MSATATKSAKGKKAPVVDLPEVPAADEQAATEPKAAEAAPTIGLYKPRNEVDLDRIDEARNRAQRARIAFNDANFKAKKLKKVMEGAYEDLDQVLAEELGPQEPHLFSEPADKASGPQDDDDSWRDVPLSSLGLADGIIKSLTSAGLTTIGELQSYLEPNDAGFTKRLIDIDGIGALKAETIERALEQFWEERAKQVDDADDGDAELNDDDSQE